MQEVRAGNVGKLEVLFDRHNRPLFRYFMHLTSNRAVSEDLVQEVFFRILKYRHTYQAETSFRAWMYQIGRNVWMDQAGKHKGEVAMPESAVGISSTETLPDRQAQNKQETALLHRALPERRRLRRPQLRPLPGRCAKRARLLHGPRLHDGRRLPD